MRVPIYIVIILALLAIILPWWLGTRGHDFLTPPSKAKLEAIRNEALATLPVSSSQKDAISIRIPVTPNNDPTADPLEALEPIDIGDITADPSLDTYSERAPEGALHLLRLAAALENRNSPLRAVLAYERILDLSQADPEHIQEALLAIRRIRPTLPNWNKDPDTAFPAVIHIGTGQKFAKVLPKILDGIITDLNKASSGLVVFSHELNIGRSVQSKGAATPIAVWITGSGKDAPTTDALSFTSDDAETLRDDLLKTVFNLTRGHLSKTTSYNPAPEALEDPLTALQSNITCLLWKEFGSALKPKLAEED